MDKSVNLAPEQIMQLQQLKQLITGFSRKDKYEPVLNIKELWVCHALESPHLTCAVFDYMIQSV